LSALEALCDYALYKSTLHYTSPAHTAVSTHLARWMGEWETISCYNQTPRRAANHLTRIQHNSEQVVSQEVVGDGSISGGAGVRGSSSGPTLR